ncbi:hypothetical protein BGY98DRAFT_987432 [Russula aff. rugulosa BPL654]|nr:hypothetical protein BGY98DRAFT_987432 [Russula aff. rugulosa BPL654]
MVAKFETRHPVACQTGSAFPTTAPRHPLLRQRMTHSSDLDLHRVVSDCKFRNT